VNGPAPLLRAGTQCRLFTGCSCPLHGWKLEQRSPARVLPTRAKVLSYAFSRAKIHTFSHLQNIHTAFPIKAKSLQHIPKLCVKYADFNITQANIGAAGLIAAIHRLPAAGAELNFPLSIPEDLSEDISSHFGEGKRSVTSNEYCTYVSVCACAALPGGSQKGRGGKGSWQTQLWMPKRVMKPL